MPFPLRAQPGPNLPWLLSRWWSWTMLPRLRPIRAAIPTPALAQQEIRRQRQALMLTAHPRQRRLLVRLP